MAVSRKQRRLHGARVFIVAMVLGGLYLASLVVRIYAAGRRDDRRRADVIIVLGAAQYDGRPSAVYQGRLDHALSLYADGYAPYLLFTGGSRPGDRYTEAQAGAMYARRHGVPAGAILREPHGRTTMQSLQACAETMRAHGLERAILVSDPFHAFRLRRMAYDLGMRAVVSPAAHSRVRSLPNQAHYIGREVAAYAIYRLVGM